MIQPTNEPRAWGSVVRRLVAPTLWVVGVALATRCLLELEAENRFVAVYLALGAGWALKVASDWSQPGGLT